MTVDELRAEMVKARMHLFEAQNSLEIAADCCKGTEFHDEINKAWDQLEDIRFDLHKQQDEFEKALEAV